MQTKALAVLFSVAAAAAFVSPAQAKTAKLAPQPNAVAKPVPNLAVRTVGCLPDRASKTKVVRLTNFTGATLKQGYVVIVELTNGSVSNWQTHVKLTADLAHGGTAYGTLYAPAPAKFAACSAIVNLGKPYGG